ncbi:MAG: phosphoribosylformylglycinamidine synthase subunit PurQ [Acidimicrobiales bacterium]
MSTARRYVLEGPLDDRELARLTRKLLANDTIERSIEGELPPSFAAEADTDPRVESVRLAGLSDHDLQELSRARVLSLDLEEMRVIQAHFGAEGRDPTDAELETLAQTWSEHCVHKTFRASIELTHTAADGTTTVRRHDGLLPALRRVTEDLDPPWLRSAFVDDAGIVAFDNDLDLAFKVETHNHPSALEPFGGANTGVGGVVRDILGVSARPIACTDVLCFGPSDLPEDELPAGVLHPRRIRDGVVAGIGDYGNKLGLPTVNGAVIYDRGYIGNPLVYCGALGLLPHGAHPTRAIEGDRVVSIGGRVGRDGIHGATFSSAGMDASTVDSVGSAVQIGDPITEKGCIEVVERARDLGLYHAITDCGAGGFSSAVGEMGEDLGVDIDLAPVPLKYPGLQPWEIWLSEAQERIVMAVPPTSIEALRNLCAEWDVELTDLGSFTGDRRLRVHHGDTTVADLPMAFLHDGLPRREMAGEWSDRAPVAISVPDIDEALVLALLAHPDIASKEGVVRRYDHEVRGGTVVRPFVGPHADGPADAAVLKPLGTEQHDLAVVLSNGICPRSAVSTRGRWPCTPSTKPSATSSRSAGTLTAGPARQLLLGRPDQARPARRAGAGGRGVHPRRDAVPDAVHLRQGQPVQRVRRHGHPGHAAHLGARSRARPASSARQRRHGTRRRHLAGGAGERRARWVGGRRAAPPRRDRGPCSPRGAAAALPRGARRDHGRVAVVGSRLLRRRTRRRGGRDGGRGPDRCAGPRARRRPRPAHGPHQRGPGTTRADGTRRQPRPPDRPARWARPPHRRSDGRRSDRPSGARCRGRRRRVAGARSHDHRPRHRGRRPRVHRNAPVSRPPILIPHASGTNRDGEAAQAVALAGGDPRIVHVNALRDGAVAFADHAGLLLPGGFSYGDALGAGGRLALELRTWFADDVDAMIAAGKPVLGICNGFQVLVKSGLLPGPTASPRRVTLSANARGHFECRWVTLRVEQTPRAGWLAGLAGSLIRCPVAHGEGRIMADDGATLDALATAGQVAFRYQDAGAAPAASTAPAGGAYPANPNGSEADIAGLCDPSGLVVGLMPHPEDHVHAWQRPSGPEGASGRALFEAFVDAGR